MQRWKCIVAYDGTAFSGYQVQPDKRTVQQEIEDVLARMHKGLHIKIISSGRTDAGVHAEGQVFHFDSPLQMQPENWKKALNAQLPDDIFIKEVNEARDDFHARFDVVKKEYRYRIVRSKDLDIFKRNYTHHVPYPLDLSAMKKAAQLFIGTFDFTAYCSAKTEVSSKVRTIYELEMIEDGDELIFRFVGNGFLYNMVRLIMGDLLRIGQGKLAHQHIQQMLLEGKRSVSGLNVPGSGLVLWKVSYDNES